MIISTSKRYNVYREGCCDSSIENVTFCKAVDYISSIHIPNHFLVNVKWIDRGEDGFEVISTYHTSILLSDDACGIDMVWYILESPSKRLSMWELVTEVAEIDSDDPTNIPEEECTELLKEICKTRRGKGNQERLAEEAIDVITSCTVLLSNLGYSQDKVRDSIRYKLNKTIYRHNNKV